MEFVPSLFGFEGRDWPRRSAAILVWLAIAEGAQGLVLVLHAGQATNLLLTIGGVMVASAVADRIAGAAIVPAPTLFALLGIGLVAGVLCGHAIAGRYALDTTGAEICMIGGAILIEGVFVAIYRATCVVRARDPQWPANVMLRTARR